MSSKHPRLDLSRFKRYHNTSDSSSTLDPIIPVLESPVMFHAMMPGTVSEVTLKQKSSLERNPMIPSVFIDEAEEEESTVPEMKSRPSTNPKPPRRVNRSFDEGPAARLKTRYFEDAFSARGPLVSMRNRVDQESIVVVDVKFNTRVCNYDQGRNYLIRTDQDRPRITKLSSHKLRLASPRSTRNPTLS